MGKLAFTFFGLVAACFSSLQTTAAQRGRDVAEPWGLKINQTALPYTKHLPPVDKVELMKIGETAEGGDIRSIAATKAVMGKQAQAIASLWRSQVFDYRYSAACHNPAYAIKFYSRNNVVVYASICWECHNIAILEPSVDLNAHQGFNSHGKAGQNLLRMFTRAFPNREKARLPDPPNKSLHASGGSVFRIIIGPAMLE